jgi:Flp pilus assembly pilin Flp
MIDASDETWRRGHAEQIAWRVNRRVAGAVVKFTDTAFTSRHSSFDASPPDAPFRAGREVNRMLKLYAYIQSYASSLRREEGQTMAEYGVILAVITAGVLVALGLLSGQIEAVITRIANVIK